MERLEAAQRAKIKKMSDDALRQNLLKAGVEDVKLAAMTREQLMDAWAEATLSEAAAKAPPHVSLSYDVELEKRRLDFEVRKFEAEEARVLREEQMRKEEREREEARVLREEQWRKEEREREEQMRKEERERERMQGN